MIKQIVVAECDICGVMQKAKLGRGQYNEDSYVLPDGWMRSEANSDFCICSECWKKLTKEAL